MKSTKGTLLLIFSGVIILGVGIPIIMGMSIWIKVPVLMLGVTTLAVGFYQLLSVILEP